ncbi:MAG: TrkH family potassium uptake protein [Natronomonas sp.]|uniref:TrkH family potassium uptake protein n=1 Tax=Natronomonas sp. TaxID=2184060 RepID=UPI00287093F4|nr:TrkH family potassium uptake protein [Natronomonas sp.]MDR9380257.1 TrkH family potassium uptake protein [Natronomonas sp.]MDR9430699.1 TrkH family potassium uptake protein [Natronomonas sp.]
MVRVRVDWRTSLDLTGRILLYLAIPLVFPLVIAVWYGESVIPFVVAIVVTIALGGGLRSLPGDPGDLGPREAFLAVAVIWFLVATVGAIPFVTAGMGTIAHPINAMFEAMSGLTTTGATTLVDFSIHDRSILMWRQLLQWLGGLGILILATAILSELGVGGAQLMETETRTRNVNKLTPRISETARLIWGLYVGLTALAVVVYYGLHLVDLAPKMGLYNAVAHALTSVSTAGFSPEPLSIGAFAPIVQWAVIPFMIAGSTSFVLMYFAINGEPMRLLKNEEFHFYIGALAFFTTLVAAALVFDPNAGFGAEATFRHAAFNVASMVTTTGYASVDFDLWSAAGKHMLFLCMFLGGMVGSTTCSIKSLRWLVALKAFRRNLFTSVHPEAVRPVRLSGRTVDEETIRDIYAYLLLSLVIFFLFTILIVVDAARIGANVSEFDAMGAAASTFLNIGPAFGEAGPYGTYNGFSMATKTAMILLMWIGRIEIIPVLVLFTRAFWRT